MSRAVRWLSGAPAYPADEGDRRPFALLGLRLPWRASVVVTYVTFALLFDYSRTFLPADVLADGSSPRAMFVIAIERAILFGAIPLALVLLAFRDRVSRYGLRLGDWRTGIALTAVGCAAMTPIVLWFAAQPAVQGFYGPRAAPIPALVLTHALDLAAAEFLFRGFLMFTLLRAVGPLGVLLATWPFVFAHLGKPELELLSTLGGGLVYGWLAWRTGSILWGAIGHVYILTLVTAAAGHGAGTVPLP